MTATRASRRADLLLVEKGLAPTRARAQALVLAGRVTADGRPVRKAGEPLAPGCELHVAGPAEPYASRAGRKIESALDAFGVDPAGLLALDVGASTGGFTDCLLARGAARVIAVDVGRGQLDARLRSDPRVEVRERTNARTLRPEDFPEQPGLCVADVSFISLTKILPAVRGVLGPGAPIVALVKPQFEAGREKVGRGGIVRDPGVHEEVLLRIAGWAAANGFSVEGLCPSPIAGAEGNREFFIHLRPGTGGLRGEPLRARVAEIVREVTHEPDPAR